MAPVSTTTFVAAPGRRLQRVRAVGHGVGAVGDDDAVARRGVDPRAEQGPVGVVEILAVLAQWVLVGDAEPGACALQELSSHRLADDEPALERVLDVDRPDRW